MVWAQILNNPKLQIADQSGEFFALVEPMTAWVVTDKAYRFGSGSPPAHRITVPAGFLTDFASIPAFCWPVATKLGPWNLPAVLHDYLYFAKHFSRKVADYAFLSALRNTGVAPARSATMFAAVRCFGFLAWRNK